MKKYLYEYETLTSDPHRVMVKNVNPYLVEGSNTAPQKRSKPLCDVPEIKFGNQPIDGGHLILSPEERHNALQTEPNIEHLIRPFLGSRELINGGERYCLWLKDAAPQEIRQSKFITERLEKVKQSRLESSRAATNELAKTPGLFGFTSHEDTPYLAVPNSVIKQQNIKNNTEFSNYNFRNKKHREAYEETGKLPSNTPSLYNQDAIDHIVGQLKSVFL